jgi:hypothetical protein
MSTDRVLTINDYYDGPRLGNAELDGVPHIYEAEFDHSTDEYGDTYFLSPIDERLFALVLEAWAIWCRWHLAYSRNEVTLESHPALSEDRQRHEELQRLIGDGLKTNPSSRKRYRATFSTPVESRGTWNGALVTWREALHLIG